MSKGWYGNSQKHSLASKGIRTGNRTGKSINFLRMDEQERRYQLEILIDKLNPESENYDPNVNTEDIDNLYQSFGIKSLLKNEVQTIFNYYHDAGHGWLKVPLSLIEHLEISKDISNYSYVKNGYVYLEEDSDASIFIEAYRNLYDMPKIIENYDGDESIIRDYRSYNAKGVKRISENKWVKSFDTSTESGIEEAEKFKEKLENKFDIVETKLIGVDEVLITGQNTKSEHKKPIVHEIEHLGFHRDEVMHNAYMKSVDNITARNGNQDREIKFEMKKVLKDNGYERYVELV